VALIFDRRRLLGVAAIVLCAATIAMPARAVARSLLHATLLRSTPSANSRIAKSPESIRLVFSEQIVPDLSQITLVGPNGDSASLKVANDPHDVHVLVGSGLRALSGPYKVVWRVLSADGHPVGGAFTFTVGSAGTATSTTPTFATPSVTKASDIPVVVAPSTAGLPPSTSEDKPVPLFASLFRGVGLGAFMTGIGILFFGLTAGERRTLIPGAFVTSLIAVGALLLVAHAIAWLEHVSPTGHLSSTFMSSVLDSTVGRVEAARVAFAVLTVWAVALARHRKIALALGIACLLLSGAVGHPAAIHPFLAIPSKAIHLLAGAVWIGGLLWLVWLARCDADACRIEARRVSSIALIAVIAILLTGLLEAVLFLNTPSDLFRSDYGKLVFNKMVGLVILIGFGVYNRFSLIPRVEALDMQRKLSRSVKLELAVMTVVILISGFLAYVPTPPLTQSAIQSAAGVSP
jgi:copper transport protein